MAPDGSAHIAGNAHASPLFYAVARGGNLATVRETPIVGQDEIHATYPTFLRDAQGNLDFLYRSGGSGNGTWIVDHWAGDHWDLRGTSFSPIDKIGSSISAYPSPIVADQHGISHVAIVWRKTPDVSTNFAVSYARTTDFQHWSGMRGPALKGPVRPDQMDIIDQPGENSGLLNSARLLLSTDGTPVLFFTRYGANGNDALIAARPRLRTYTDN
jgi:hypothetical protein